MSWRVPKIWQGGDVWIIGGGASIVEQFQIPAEVVEQVRKNKLPISVYGPYMKAIHSKHTIGVNVAFMLGAWVDVMFFGDRGFFLKFKNELAGFAGVRISCHHLAEKEDWIKYLEKDRRNTFGITSHPKKVSWNLNSGGAAISVAANMGVKRIFLLGFDMNLDAEQNQHFHNKYRGQKDQPVVNKVNRKIGVPFKSHMKCFPKIAKDAEERDIEIINVNPKSAIKQFRKVTLEEALNE